MAKRAKSTKKKLHLNGESADFLENYYTFQQRMLDHLNSSEKDSSKQEHLEESVNELKTASAVAKTKIESMDVEMKVVLGLLVSIFLLMVGGFIYLFTNGVPTTP